LQQTPVALDVYAADAKRVEVLTSEGNRELLTCDVWLALGESDLGQPASRRNCTGWKSWLVDRADPGPPTLDHRSETRSRRT
jgi:hypothetical protein